MSSHGLISMLTARICATRSLATSTVQSRVVDALHDTVIVEACRCDWLFYCCRFVFKALNDVLYVCIVGMDYSFRFEWLKNSS